MPFPIPDIVVTGHALPATDESIYAPVIIDRERLTLNASGRIEDLLSDVAGFQSFRRSDSRSANPTSQGAVLRGIGGNASGRLLVLLDGVPQGDPFFGTVEFNALVPSQIARISVTRGAGAGPFGLGGVAGVVEMESAGPDEMSGTSGSLAIGSRDSIDAQAAFVPQWSEGFAMLAARVEHGAGFWTTPPDQRTAASVRSAYDDESLTGRLVTRLGDGELQLSARRFLDRRVLRFDGADDDTNGSDGSLRWVRRGSWSLDALAYVQDRNFSTVAVSATTFKPTLDQRATPSTGVGGRIELRSPERSGISIRVGGDLRHAVGTVFEDSLAGTGAVTASHTEGGHQFDAGAYGEADAGYGTLRVSAGARLDYWRQSGALLRTFTPSGTLTNETRPQASWGWLPSGRAGAHFQLAKPIAIRMAAYASARLPTLNELYRNFTVFPVTTLANSALRPERLLGAEMGLEIKPLAGLTIGATLFDNHLADAIANVTIGSNLRRRENVSAIVSKGGELEAQWRFSHGSLALSWTGYRARMRTNDALNGKRPAQTPDHAESATLTLSPIRTIDLSATLRHTGLAYEDDLNVDSLPATTTADAVVRWQFTRRLALELRAENLTDARIITRNQAGSIDLGLPRTLWVALSLR